MASCTSSSCARCPRRRSLVQSRSRAPARRSTLRRTARKPPEVVLARLRSGEVSRKGAPVGRPFSSRGAKSTRSIYLPGHSLLVVLTSTPQRCSSGERKTYRARRRTRRGNSVVDQIVADIQILVMREDQPFVRVRAEMSLHPPELVAPRGCVLPRRGRQDVG